MDGDAIEEAEPIEFMTGTSSLGAASLTILPEPLHALTSDYEFADIQAVLTGGTGNEGRNVAAVWSSSDSTLVSLSETIIHAGRSAVRLQAYGRSGTAVITATAGGRTATTTITLSQTAFS